MWRKTLSRPQVAVLAIAALQVCGILGISRLSGFHYDDFINSWLAARFAPSREYFLWANYDHFGLGQRIVHWIVLRGGGLSWGVVSGAMIVTGLLTLYTAWRCARVLAGESWWTVGGVALVALSPLWANSWMWWASTSDFTLTLPAMFVALELACRRALGAPRWTSVGAALAVGVALLSQERPFILPCVFVLVVVALIAERLHPRLLWRHVISVWDLWCACGVVLAAYLVLMLKGRYLQNELPGTGFQMSTSDPAQLSRFLGLNLGQLLLPSLTGVLPGSWPMAVVITAAVAALLALLGVLVAIPRAWRALMLWVLAAEACMLPVAIGRGALIHVALEPRYSVDVLPFTLLAVALLGREVQAGRVRPGFRGSWGAAGMALRWVAMCALAGVSFVSMETFARTYMGSVSGEAHRFVEAVRRLPAGPDETFIDGALPLRLFLVPPENNGPYGTLSEFIRVARPELSLGNRSARFINTITPLGEGVRFRREATATRAFERSEQADGTVRCTLPVPPELSGASALLLELPPSENGALWVTPLRVQRDAPEEHEVPVPAQVSSVPNSAVIRIDARTVAVGVTLRGHEHACASPVVISALTALPLAP